MRPFGLGHRLLLEQIESGFVGQSFPTYADLISGAFICAHSWAENQLLLRSPFRRWLMLKTWGLLAGRFNVPAAMVSFHAYARDGDTFPEVQQKPSSEVRQLASPRLARLYLFLRSKGFSEQETMDMPLNVANLLYCTDAEQEGRLDLVTDTFKEMIRLSQGGLAA